MRTHGRNAGMGLAWGYAHAQTVSAQTSFRRKPESRLDDLIIDSGDTRSPEPQRKSSDMVAEINRLDPGFSPG
jgi:hypothetical protein